MVTATITRTGETLHFSGLLRRDTVLACWSAAQPLLPGVRRFDLAAVEHLDSAGLALLVELAHRTGTDTMTGDPPGLAELRTAYRLPPTLAFASGK